MFLASKETRTKEIGFYEGTEHYEELDHANKEGVNTVSGELLMS